MSYLDGLLPCSFKEVPFLWNGALRTTGGNKTVTHEFVNSNIRFVEQLGPLLKTFSLTGVVSGVDYLQKKDKLIEALEEPTSGILQHPTFGRVEVVAKPYTVTEDDSSIGQAVFELAFELAKDVADPQPATSNLASISASIDGLNSKLADDTKNGFNVSSKFKNSFAAASSLLNSFSEELNSIVDLFAPANELVAQLSSDLSNFQGSITSLLSQPTALANGILGLLEQANSILDVPADQLNTIKSLFGFNSSSPNITVDTVAAGNSITEEDAEIISNEKLITRQIRMTSLSFAYSNASLIEFGNISELDETASLIEEQFQLLINDEDIPSDTRLAIQDTRALFESFLSEQRLSVKQIQTLTIKRMPMQVLAYQLYGDSEQVQALVDLNSSSDVSHVEGSVEVLTT